MRRQKKSFFAHHARLDDSDEEDFEGVLKNWMVEEFVKLNNFLMTRRRRGVFETKRGVIFEHTMMGITSIEDRSFLRAFVSEPAKKNSSTWEYNKLSLSLSLSLSLFLSLETKARERKRPARFRRRRSIITRTRHAY